MQFDIKKFDAKRLIKFEHNVGPKDKQVRIVAGAVLVFIPCLGAFLTPDLLGGGKTVMLGNLVQNQFTTARDWPFGSAASLVLMLASALLLAALMRSRAAKELL